MAIEATKKSTAGKKSAGRTPRYLQVADELRKAILAGEFSGISFPTETMLCERFDVSRFTVREALRLLEADGMIARRRGSGTTVQQAAARGGALHQPLSNVGELLQYARGSEVTYAETGEGMLPVEIAEQISEPTAGVWRCFRGARYSPEDPLPIAVTDAYFHEMLGDAVSQLDLSFGTLFSQIEKNTPFKVGKVTQDIQAIAASEETARALSIEEGKPVLRILRCYFDPRGRIFEISVSHHPGDRFAYAMHIDVED